MRTYRVRLTSPWGGKQPGSVVEVLKGAMVELERRGLGVRVSDEPERRADDPKPARRSAAVARGRGSA